MLSVTPTADNTLGVTIEGLDLSTPLSAEDFEVVRQNLGERGVIRFPNQSLDPLSLREFCRPFGEIDGTDRPPSQWAVEGVREVDNLSNIIENGKPVGIADAGQEWHTDMAYDQQIGFANVLFAIEVPVRDGRPLGATQFQDMHAAYEDLPADFKEQYKDAVVWFDFNKFYDMMINERGSTRPPLTDEQRAMRPPSAHPMFLEHPITGKRVLYANPGYAVSIEGLPADESTRVLDHLFEHQLQEKYRYVFHWTVGDVLMWDNMGTLHEAVSDYGPEERRHIQRCRVKAAPEVGRVLIHQ